MEKLKSRIAQLRQRLLTANLRSRSLRLRRTTRSGAFDLHRLKKLNPQALERIQTEMGRAEPVKVPLLPAKGGDEQKRDASEDLRRLSNAAHRTWMEVGENELLLGWPLIEAKLNETWLRAPLLLFPVTLKRTRRGRLTWQLTISGRPDANEVLVQALFRLGGVRLSLERLVELDDDNQLKPDDASWTSLEQWLGEGGLTLETTGKGIPKLEPIQPRNRDDRDDYTDSRAQLLNQLVLGRFPQSSSSVLSEYNDLEERLDLLQEGPAAELLAVDLSELGDSDLQTEALSASHTSKDATPDRVLPSDSSQEAVIRALDHVDGRSLVVRGPPGTGKSQLIANMIGQAIQRDERVVMICQKRAALDVVAQRLESIGLSEPLALVHDTHHDRQDFCNSLVASLEMAFNTEGQLDLSQSVRDEKRATSEHDAALRRFQSRLDSGRNAYRLLMAVGPGGQPLAELLERALDDDGRQLPDLTDVAGDATEDDLIQALPDIEAHAFETQKFASPHSLAVRTDWKDLGEDKQRELKSALDDFKNRLLECSGNGRATMTPGEAYQYRDLWESCDGLLDLFDSGTSQTQHQFALFWTFSDAGLRQGIFSRLLERLNQSLEDLSTVPSGLFEHSSEQVIDWRVALEELAALRKKWWRPFLPSFWRLRRTPDNMMAQANIEPNDLPAKIPDDLIRLCHVTLRWHELVRDVAAIIDESPFYSFGCRGKREDIENAIAEIRDQQTFVEQLKQLHKGLKRSHPDYGSLPKLDGNVDYSNEPFFVRAQADRSQYLRLRRAQRQVDELTPFFRSTWLRDLLGPAKAGSPDVQPIDDVLACWDETTEAAASDRRIGGLPIWGKEFLRFYESHNGESSLTSDVRLALERAWRTLALDDRSLRSAESALVDESHRSALENAYKKMIESTAPSVAARYYQRIRRAASGNKMGLALRKMLKDAQKKRYRLSIRQFVERYWDDCLGLLRPVWLCSPESVAALFPLSAGLFDRVIMDEASQCPVESALPALVRGKSLMVAGDEKQMPPSHFFTRRDDDEYLDEEEDSALLAAESILDVARVAYPGTMLLFHYRSRHEELITFSNHAFYGGRLVTAPLAEVCKEPYEGMKTEIVNGLWKDQTNRIEAERVVEIVTDLLAQELPNGKTPTLGVVTFNQKQRELIESLLDEKALDDEVARELLAADRERPAIETLFVKNIENVQGDERDIIIFSVGYGPTETGGRVHARFGPIGVEGGENRLNVAITRAKRGVFVLASFAPNQLDTRGTKHLGPKLFHAYLDYANSAAADRQSDVERVLHEVALLTSSDSAKPTRLKRDPVGTRVREELATRLEWCGLEVARDFGIGPYRLDLAVRRKSATDRWGCGVDCTRFLQVPDTLQRDITEPTFWKRAGWQIFRVSPGTWLERKDEVVAEIVDAVGVEL